MSNAMTSALADCQVFTKETLINGSPGRIRCLQIGGQTFTLSSGPIATVSLEDEWYDDLADPEMVIRELQQNSRIRPDLLTFWQRIPETQPKYDFYHEWEEIAVLPIISYQHWLKHQIKSRTRNLIRKAEKEGVVVRETVYDDDFVRGMTAIFNESPVRQGRSFWHYGKDFSTVKAQFSRFVHREYMIGAYYQDEMIGFVMMGDAGRFGLTGQIISSLHHRDKSTSNALIAKAVEVCEDHSLKSLVYLFWGDDTLAEFKRRCGFEPVRVPRFYVPLSWKGRLALRCGAHRGWKAMLPSGFKASMKRLRSKWNEQRAEWSGAVQRPDRR